MANTYTQIHIQAVYVVKNRESLIHPTWKDELYKYITGIIRSYNHKVLVINGMPDHIHILFGMRADQSLSDLMQIVKTNSSKWINERKLTKNAFSWQVGYGAFSYSQSHLPRVINYIENQEEHHRSKSFTIEYKEFLKENGIEYNERFIFQALE